MTSHTEIRRRITALYSEQNISERIEELADLICARVQNPAEPMVMIGLLRGAVPFVADLSRALARRELPLVVDFLSAASYGAGQETSGSVRIGPLPEQPIEGREVLVVDDILDSGLTLAKVTEVLGSAKPLRVSTCVLLDKPARRVNAFHADFSGFSCPDAFVVGYGMDLDGQFRELPFIGTVGAS